MSKLLIHTFRQGEEKPNPRGCTSIDQNAATEAVQALVRKQVLRVGSKAERVEIVDDAGQVLDTWTFDEPRTNLLDSKGASIPMAKSKETEVAKKAAKPATAKKAKTSGTTKTPRGESKTGIVAALLKRKSGCTCAEVLAATEWPTVSMPAMAKAAGLSLRKEKTKGEVTRYYGA